MALSWEVLGDGLTTTTFTFMVCFNSLSCFFFNFKSDLGMTVVFTFLAGFNVMAGLVLVVSSWFVFFSVSGFGVVFISFCVVLCIGFMSCVGFWFGWFTGFMSRFGFVWFRFGFCSKLVSSWFLYNSFGGFKRGGFSGESECLVLFLLVCCSILVIGCCRLGLVMGVVLTVFFFGFLTVVGFFLGD